MFDLLYTFIFMAIWIFICWLLLKDKYFLPGGNRKANYNAYMSSPAWRNKRRSILSRDGYKCSLCGSRSNLQVHHKTYKNFTHEQPGELMTVCRSCHNRIHHKNF